MHHPSSNGRVMFALVSAIGCAAVYGGTVPATLIAQSGQQAPGFPAGTTFSEFEGASSSSGAVAFDAFTPGANLPNGVWRWSPSTGLVPLAQAGMQPPGLLRPSVFHDVQLAGIDGAGDVLLQASFSESINTPPQDFDRGAWVADASGAIQLLAAHGSQVPGQPNGTEFDSVGTVGIGNGVSVVSGTWQSAAPSSGWFAGHSSGDLSPLLLSGTLLPGAAPGATLYQAVSVEVGPNVTALNALLSDGTVGIWVRSESAFHPVLLSGQTLAGGLTVAVASPNLAGVAGNHILLQAMTSMRAGYLFVEADPNGNLQTIVRPDGPVPGVPGAQWAYPNPHDYPSYRINTAGEVALVLAFKNFQTGQEGKGIWIGSAASGLHPLAIEGENIPGSSTETYFSLGGLTFIGAGLVMNDSGQIAFGAQLGTNGQESSSTAIFGYDPSLGAFPLIRSGDRLELSPNNFETVQAMRPVSLDDAGRLLVWGFFSDGSTGLFEVTVPGPGFAASAVVAALWYSRRSRNAPSGRRPG